MEVNLTREVIELKWMRMHIDQCLIVAIDLTQTTHNAERAESAKRLAEILSAAIREIDATIQAPF